MKTLHFDLEVEVSSKEDEFNLTLQLRKLWFDYQASPQGQNLKMVCIQQVGVRSPRQSRGADTEAEQGAEQPQQLKAKISACINRYLDAINQPGCTVELSDFIRELRQLSAV